MITARTRGELVHFSVASARCTRCSRDENRIKTESTDVVCVLFQKLVSRIKLSRILMNAETLFLATRQHKRN